MTRAVSAREAPTPQRDAGRRPVSEERPLRLTRIQRAILDTLVQAEAAGERLTYADLATAAGVSSTSIAHHVRRLTTAGYTTHQPKRARTLRLNKPDVVMRLLAELDALDALLSGV
ncbi:MAG: winged helix-turn-helix domain-containing protein [Ktedonobacterales bacterium]|nr:winged helix-turn-helix domain-containing protein [Ktedonobacterales bacterium]